MIAAAYGTVSDIEVFWVLISLVGLGFSLYNIREARGDIEFLDEHNIENGRRVLAKFNLVAECLRAYIQSVFAFIGMLACVLPEVPNTLDLPTWQTITRSVITWGLISSSLALTVKSYLGKRVRDTIRGG